MNTSVRDYLRKYPSARPGTLALIERRAALHAQLRDEIEQSRAANRTPRQWLKYYAGKLKVLAGEWRA